MILISEFHRLYKSDGLSIEVIKQFRSIIYNYFKQKGRNFPFRKNITPYNVLVSEIMLQQTQTGRVAEKFLNFIEKFPNFNILSEAPLEEVLKTWQGLGYNRRAIALKKIAEIVIDNYHGELPDSVEKLKKFPQIGHNTASSIISFAFNKPTIFIETNIRRVYIYFFFPGRNNITDKEINPILKKTIDTTNPRKWYYALMDYGVMLKKKYPDLNKRSAHYRKQTPFKGSNRQIRGEILSILIKNKTLKISDLREKLKEVNNEKLLTIINQLEIEGFIETEEDVVQLIK
ncbi:MAG: A/G-specific adenine glycosylase [Candidatus Hodarchaeota archaeon]